MSIEQHAEAAAAEDDYRAELGDGPEKAEIIAHCMRKAIDEATAPLLARIAELEAERGHDATTKAN